VTCFLGVVVLSDLFPSPLKETSRSTPPSPQPWAPSALLTHTPFGIMPGRAAAKNVSFKRRNLVPQIFMAMQRDGDVAFEPIYESPFKPPMNCLSTL